MTTTATESPWTGWHRPHRQAAWRVVVHAESEAEAWDLLLAYTAGGDKCVLPVTRRPDNYSQRDPNP
jgi:hypothetical protein